MIAMAPPRPARHTTAIPQQAPSGGGQAPPLDCRVTLAPGGQAASEARGLLRTVIATWGLRVDADAAVLLASELVANAVTHAGGDADGAAASVGGMVEGGALGAITMCVRCSRGELRVEVHDWSRSTPAHVPLAVDDDAETGRGLMLVDTLATEWGFYRTPGGKVVYFTLPLEAGL